jgi:hypothetical protein
MWPEARGGLVPSPQHVAALLALGQLPAERVPWWAAAWVADGQGAEATAEIAGLDGRDPHAIRDLLPAVRFRAQQGLDTSANPRHAGPGPGLSRPASGIAGFSA